MHSFPEEVSEIEYREFCTFSMVRVSEEESSADSGAENSLLTEEYDQSQRRISLEYIIEYQKRDFYLKQVRRCIMEKNLNGLKRSKFTKVYKRYALNLIFKRDI